MAKSFKDHYIENSDKVQAIRQPTLIIEDIEPIKPSNKHKEEIVVEHQPTIKVDNAFAKEVLKTEIRDEVETKIAEEVENKVRIELTEKYEHELKEFKQQLTESFLTEMVTTMNTNNNMLIKVIESLAKKVEGLQESLIIDIPAPVVNVTMPDRKVERVVHRDSKDRITRITERDQDE